jgi:CTP-dependent riboflavin kinase
MKRKIYKFRVKSTRGKINEWLMYYNKGTLMVKCPKRNHRPEEIDGIAYVIFDKHPFGHKLYKVSKAYKKELQRVVAAYQL